MLGGQQWSLMLSGSFLSRRKQTVVGKLVQLQPTCVTQVKGGSPGPRPTREVEGAEGRPRLVLIHNRGAWAQAAVHLVDHCRQDGRAEWRLSIAQAAVHLVRTRGGALLLSSLLSYAFTVRAPQG